MTAGAKWIIGLLVLVVLGGGAYWVYQAQEGEGLMQEEGAMMNETSSTTMHDESMSSSTGMTASSSEMMGSSTDEGMQDNGVMTH